MFDMTYFVPRHLHNSLKWLGTKDFFKLNLVADNQHTWSVRGFEQQCTRKELEEHHELINVLHLAEGDMLGLLCMHAKTIANGPKLFSPSLENCIVMENVDLHLPFDDYRQPFNPLMIEFPASWRKRIAERVDADCPQYVICYRHESGSVSLQSYFKREDIISSLAAARPQYTTIEDSLLPLDDNADKMYHLSRMFQRMAMNFCVLLTHVGTKDLGPVDPQQHARNEQMIRQKRNRERGELFRTGEIHRIGMDQSIRLYDVDERGESSGEDGKSPHPHWRRGHWKRQAHGPGMSLRKRIFINPVFVCAKRFEGDLATTNVNYRDHFNSIAVVNRLPVDYRSTQ